MMVAKDGHMPICFYSIYPAGAGGSNMKFLHLGLDISHGFAYIYIALFLLRLLSEGMLLEKYLTRHGMSSDC